jgi:hypothetical protein
MSTPGVLKASSAWLLLEFLALPRMLMSRPAPFHGVCFSLGLQGCSSDLPILSWRFGHEGNYYEARHAARRQEKKTVENYQRIGLQPYLRP